MAASLATSRDIWRVAALTMMESGALSAALAGEDAAAWVEAAAACGVPEALLRLGRMLLEGKDVAQDRHAAFDCFLRAARQGSIDAHNMLGRCYENGWGTQTDYAAAAREYRVAAEAGLDWAQYNLGHMLLSGSGVTRDRDTAFLWYSRASAQGHARAMSLVGRCYEQGWGIAADAVLARDWYRRSAEGGYFRGAYNYASLIAEDGCVAEALHWFERALSDAPEPTHSHMLAALARHKIPALRALASQLPSHVSGR